MSIIVEARCSKMETLLKEHPELRKEDVTAGSQELRFLLFPDYIVKYSDDKPSLQEILDNEFGFDVDIFKNLDDEDEVTVSASEAIKYFQGLLEILKRHAKKLPQVYLFQELATKQCYWETIIDNTALKGGYDTCVAIGKTSVKDLRGYKSISVENKEFHVLSKSVYAVFGEPLQEMFKVARTAKRFGQDVIISAL